MDRLPARGQGWARVALFALLAVAAMTGRAHAQTGSIGANFQTIDNNTTGIVSGFTVQPPDTTGAVGLNHFIEFNNGSFCIFNKNGTLVGSRRSDGQFWTDAGISITTNNLSDPRLLYDPGSRRWFACQISVNETTNNRILIAR